MISSSFYSHLNKLNDPVVYSEITDYRFDISYTYKYTNDYVSIQEHRNTRFLPNKIFCFCLYVSKLRSVPVNMQTT